MPAFKRYSAALTAGEVIRSDTFTYRHGQCKYGMHERCRRGVFGRGRPRCTLVVIRTTPPEGRPMSSYNEEPADRASCRYGEAGASYDGAAARAPQSEGGYRPWGASRVLNNMASERNIIEQHSRFQEAPNRNDAMASHTRISGSAAVVVARHARPVSPIGGARIVMSVPVGGRAGKATLQLPRAYKTSQQTLLVSEFYASPYVRRFPTYHARSTAINPRRRL